MSSYPQNYVFFSTTGSIFQFLWFHAVNFAWDILKFFFSLTGTPMIISKKSNIDYKKKVYFDNSFDIFWFNLLTNWFLRTFCLYTKLVKKDINNNIQWNKICSAFFLFLKFCKLSTFKKYSLDIFDWLGLSKKYKNLKHKYIFSTLCSPLYLFLFY